MNAVKLLSASPCAAVCRNMPESIDDDMMARCTEELFESHSETAQESWTQIHGNIPTEVITGALGVVGLALCFLGWSKPRHTALPPAATLRSRV